MKSPFFLRGDNTEYSIIIDEVRGKGRPRATTIGGRPHLYTDKKTAEYEEKIKNTFIDKYPDFSALKCCVKVSIDINQKVPSQTKKDLKRQMLSGDVRVAKKPDIDNIVKSILDGLNGVAWIDDAQVTEISARKYWGITDRVTVTIETIGDGNNEL